MTIQITIRAHGKTVAEALAHARAAAHDQPLGLDGVVRPIYQGDKEIGSIQAYGSDADKLAHYTGKDVAQEKWVDPTGFPAELDDVDINVPPWTGGACS